LPSDPLMSNIEAGALNLPNDTPDQERVWYFTMQWMLNNNLGSSVISAFKEVKNEKFCHYLPSCLSNPISFLVHKGRSFEECLLCSFSYNEC